ncbi:DUF5678 domain-containing protein [Mycobacteroides chelonae]|uniref:DUF5678 domain-containing protein n=1 Tax=Mycobacteroides chelonae TaxID=1774 RepID=UPI0020B63A14|nr:DUF5678 domain-containing protein [Mycobacteroides chelonae]
MSITETSDQNRGLYRRFDLYRIDEDGEHQYLVTDPYFILRYTTDPHARVALEAYADSCRDEYPALAADLYRQLGIDITEADQLETITPALAQRLIAYQGQWVAIASGDIVARADDLHTLQATLDEYAPGRPVTVFRVPAEGEPRLHD